MKLFISVVIIVGLGFAHTLYAQTHKQSQGEKLIRAAIEKVASVEALELECVKRYESTAELVNMTMHGRMKLMRYPDRRFLIHTFSEDRWEGMLSPDTLAQINLKDSAIAIWLRSNTVSSNPALDFISEIRLPFAPEMITNIRSSLGGSPGKLKRILKENEEDSPRVETVTDDGPVWTIVYEDSSYTARLVDGEMIAVRYGYSHTIKVRKKDAMPVYTEFKSEVEGEVDLTSYEITSISFNPSVMSISDRLSQLADDFALRVVKPDKEHVPSELGTPIEWAGRYLDGDTVSSDDFAGSYTLYKFTYRGCSTCHHMIPLMKHLKKRFPTLAVVELDPYDRGDEDNMRKYIEKYEIEYPFIFISRDDPTRLNINGFPTFYLVDPEGKLVWQDIGVLDQKDVAEQIGKIVDTGG
jgi:thiol-disulfide isomerase/thioredoxin